MDDKRAEQKIEEIQNLLGCCHAVEYEPMGECTQSGEPERCDARPDMTFLLDALEAARKENAELRAALEEACCDRAIELRNSDDGGTVVCQWLRKKAAHRTPHLAAWLRQQEVQG